MGFPHATPRHREPYRAMLACGNKEVYFTGVVCATPSNPWLTLTSNHYLLAALPQPSRFKPPRALKVGGKFFSRLDKAARVCVAHILRKRRFIAVDIRVIGDLP